MKKPNHVSKSHFLKCDEASSSGRVTKTLASTADLCNCYELSVQEPQKEVNNLLAIYYKATEASSTNVPYPKVLREDFCGTALLCKIWLQKNIAHQAVGIDIDPSVISYALKTHFPDEEPTRERVRLVLGDVCTAAQDDQGESLIGRANILVALNYSVFYFHNTKALLKYFEKAIGGLCQGGVFIFDLFGGSLFSEQTCVKTIREFPTFKYVFQQKNWNFFTERLNCTLSFKFKDGSVLNNVFNYDFKMWSVAELTDALKQVGFTEIHCWIQNNDNTSTANYSAKQEFLHYEYFNVLQPNDGASFRPLKSWNAYIAASSKGQSLTD